MYYIHTTTYMEIKLTLHIADPPPPPPPINHLILNVDLLTQLPRFTKLTLIFQAFGFFKIKPHHEQDAFVLMRAQAWCRPAPPARMHRAVHLSAAVTALQTDRPDVLLIYDRMPACRTMPHERSVRMRVCTRVH